MSDETTAFGPNRHSERISDSGPVEEWMTVSRSSLVDAESVKTRRKPFREATKSVASVSQHSVLAGPDFVTSNFSQVTEIDLRRSEINTIPDASQRAIKVEQLTAISLIAER